MLIFNSWYAAENWVADNADGMTGVIYLEPVLPGSYRYTRPERGVFYPSQV